MSPKDDEVLIQAIKKIEDDLAKLIAEVNKKKSVINELCEIMGQPPPYQIDGESGNQSLRPDQFYGKPFATAASEFLQMKKHACTAEEILNGLEKGGFNFQWEENLRLRNLAISLAKNTAVFHRLPNNTVGLLAWYPEIDVEPKRRRVPKTGQDEEAKGTGEENGENVADINELLKSK